MRTVVWVDKLEATAVRYEEEGKYAQAMILFVRAASLVDAVDRLRGATLWQRAGVCAFHVFEHRSAEEWFARAISLVPGTNVALQARLHANMCMALYMQSRLLEAYEYGNRGIAFAELANNRYLQGACRLNTGLVARYLGRFEEALDLFERARKDFQLAGLHGNDDRRKCASWAAHSLHNVGWVLIDLGNLTGAEEALTRALSEKKEIGDPAGRVLVEIARLRLVSGDAQNALRSALSVVDMAESLIDPETHVQALIVAADAAGREDAPTGLIYAETGLSLAISLGLPPLLYDLLPVLIRLKVAVGRPHDMEQALLYALNTPERRGSNASVNSPRDIMDARALARAIYTGKRGTSSWDQVASGASAPVSGRIPARRGVAGERRVVDLDSIDGLTLKRMRIDAGLTQEELAELAWCDRRTVQRAENSMVPTRTTRMLATVIMLYSGQGVTS